MKLAPTTLDNRIEALDLMRGFALLGIFIANMLFFHTPIIYIDPYTWFTGSSDENTFRWITIFVQGSFYPIFAMMFGYGINMQYEKAKERGLPFTSTQARRLSILLLVGLIHALFIWAGDILVSYAVMGFLIIWFVRVPAKWLLPIAAVLYIIPMGSFVALLHFLERIDPTSASSFVDLHQIESSISAYAHGSFGEVFMQRFTDWLTIGVASGLLLGCFMVLPLIIIGATLSKWKVIERANEMKGRLAVFAAVMIIFGVWIKSLPFINGATISKQMLQETFGGVILASGYVALILLLVQIPIFRVVFRPVAKAGRMSLTTYITQSIVATLIFYSYGFGLYGQVNLLTGTWIAIGVFAIQVVGAEIWLSKFRMGPLEWLWRKGTYGKTLSK